MCGICGVITLDGELPPAVSQAIVPMTESLRHRGPDGGGHFIDRRAALGHRRLAIIDREGGCQPMTSETGTWIVFNGEIYNHRALRAVLAQRGHKFRTASDTEVILHAYAAYGVSCLERLHGMFAFAIYDPANGTLFMARDRLGKKPLFYSIVEGVLHFASEIKALYHSPLWNGVVDEAALEGYLALGYVLAPATIYKHVRKLEPGQWMLARNGRVESGIYWDIETFDDCREPTRQLQQSTGDLIREAVEERLESEVPLGAFLSGGIDSGLVVSYMAEAMTTPVQTTSVGFGGTGHNELEAASLTAGHCLTNHVSEVVEPRLDHVLDQVVAGFDEPFADASAIPTYYVSALARRHVTVALSGDGGDEAFGGYSFRYVPHAVEDLVRQGLPAQAAGLFAWLGQQWPRHRQLPRVLRWGTVLDNLGASAESAYYADLCITKPSTVRALLGARAAADYRDSDVYCAVTAPYRRCRSSSPVQRAEYADLKIYLANDVLVKVDRMSMAHGLEVRCPLLDHRVVELAFRIPRERKMPRLRPKYLLREIARPRLPEALFRLPKHGFSAPVGEWLAGPYRAALIDELLAPSSFVSSHLDPKVVRTLIDDHYKQRDHSSVLWAIWMLERWNTLRRRQVDQCKPFATAAAS